MFLELLVQLCPDKLQEHIRYLTVMNKQSTWQHVRELIFRKMHLHLGTRAAASGDHRDVDEFDSDDEFDEAGGSKSNGGKETLDHGDWDGDWADDGAGDGADSQFDSFGRFPKGLGKCKKGNGRDGKKGDGKFRRETETCKDT